MNALFFPPHKQPDNYELVFEHDRRVFLSRNPEEMVRRTKVTYSEDGLALVIPMLDARYLIHLATGDIREECSPLAPVPVHTRLLLIHYLIYSKNTAHITHEEIPFHSIRGVSHFETAFLREAIPPLKQAFQNNVQALLTAGQALGGTVRPFGDAAVRLYLFPMIPITYILWEGDDEFPMNINILFDRGITDCTHPEDVPVLGSFGAQRLAGA